MQLSDVIRIALVGIGATAVLDAWLSILKRFGVQPLTVGLIGRWVGHMFRGKFTHPAIAKASPIRGEVVLGWLAHYAIGICFAGILFVVSGTAWLFYPSLLPAVIVGVGTVAAPFLVMQPAMGAGYFASKTPTPSKNRVRSIINHALFGVGLYLSAVIVNAISR